MSICPDGMRAIVKNKSQLERKWDRLFAVYCSLLCAVVSYFTPCSTLNVQCVCMRGWSKWRVYICVTKGEMLSFEIPHIRVDLMLWLYAMVVHEQRIKFCRYAIWFYAKIIMFNANAFGSVNHVCVVVGCFVHTNDFIILYDTNYCRSKLCCV